MTGYVGRQEAYIIPGGIQGMADSASYGFPVN